MSPDDHAPPDRQLLSGLRKAWPIRLVPSLLGIEGHPPFGWILLADYLQTRLAAAGSGLRVVVEPENILNESVESIWVYGDTRSCQMGPSSRRRGYWCNFLCYGTVLASADFEAKEAVVAAIHRWIDEAVSLEIFQFEIPDMKLTDCALEFDRGDVALWSWSRLLKQMKEEEEWHGLMLPVFERLSEMPAANRFFPFIAHGVPFLSRCSHWPYLDAGMPTVRHLDIGYRVECGNQRFDGPIDDAVDFMVQCLAEMPEQPFVGNWHDLLRDPVNKCLAEKGSSLRASRTWRWRESEITISLNDRSCAPVQWFPGPKHPPMRCFFAKLCIGGRQVANSASWTLPEMVDVMRMWLEQRCSLDDIEAVAKLHRSGAGNE